MAFRGRDQGFWGWVRFVVLGVFIGFVAVFTRPPSPQALASQRLDEAYQAAQQFVKGTLDAPTQAVFPPPGLVDIEAGGSIYRVRGYVDAPNASGNLLRHDFDCYVLHQRERPWRLMSLDMREP